MFLHSFVLWKNIYCFWKSYLYCDGEWFIYIFSLSSSSPSPLPSPPRPYVVHAKTKVSSTFLAICYPLLSVHISSLHLVLYLPWLFFCSLRPPSYHLKPSRYAFIDSRKCIRSSIIFVSVNNPSLKCFLTIVYFKSLWYSTHDVFYL